MSEKWNEEKQNEFLATTQARATGRTGRMLLEAVRLANEGRYVLVTAYSNNYARTLCRQTHYVVQSAFGGGTISTTENQVLIGKGSINFTTHGNEDKYQCRNMAVLFDHFRGNKR